MYVCMYISICIFKLMIILFKQVFLCLNKVFLFEICTLDSQVLKS